LFVHNIHTNIALMITKQDILDVALQLEMPITDKQINYVLENYIGLGKKDIQTIKKLKTRSACVFKNYPQCVLTEHNLFALSDMDS